MIGLFLYLVLLAAAQAQDAQTQPTTRPAADPQRAAELVALIEGPNSPQARLTGAKELLRQNWSDTPARLVAILDGASTPARTAVATALAELPDRLTPAYIEPLVRMLSLPDASATKAARAALAAYRDERPIAALRACILNPESPFPGRIEALLLLGGMTHREALAVLAEALADPDPRIQQRALESMQQVAGVTFERGTEGALEWWRTIRSLSQEEWQQREIERLRAENARTGGALQQVEARLGRSLRDAYLRTPESERPELLRGYLAEPLRVVRLLALELVQAELTEGKSIAPETAAAVRALLVERDPGLREAAVRTITNVRDSTDGDRLIEMLGTEANLGVRLALINGLGYLGTAATYEPLLRLLSGSDETQAGEAAAAIGRLAERGVLDAAAAAACAAALRSKYELLPRSQVVFRERLLRAMTRLRDRQFGPLFVAALDASEPPAIRQTAARGIALLNLSEFSDALIAATNDSDASVRKAAVDALAQVAATDAHLQALWARLAVAAEPDEATRESAWRGAVRVLAARPPAELNAWIERLPDNGPLRARRTIELLQLAEKALAAGKQSAELGQVRLRVAGLQAAAGQVDEALGGLTRAFQDLSSVESPDAARAALELVRLAVANEKYDERIAAALAGAKPPPALPPLWEATATELTQRAEKDPAVADRALAQLAAWLAHPPAPLTPEIRAQADELARRLQARRAAADAERTRTLLTALHTNGADPDARQALLQLGPRAVPAIADQLRQTIAADAPDTAFERVLHDLLKQIFPEWSGFSADSGRDEKLRSLDALVPQVSASPRGGQPRAAAA